MSTRKTTRIVRVGEFAAEVDIELIITEHEWSPYLTLEDAYKLDDVREVLQHGDTHAATEHARVYRLVPVAA